MSDLLATLGPVFFFVLLGALLHHLRIISRDMGRRLLDFTIVVPSTATAFLAVSQTHIAQGDILLPISAALFIAFMFVLGLEAARRMKLDRVHAGVLRIALMIPNTSFILIFAIPLLGTVGVQKIFLFELMSVPLLYSLVYAVAVRSRADFDGRDGWLSALLKKMLLFPPLLGSLAGVYVVLTSYHVPALVTTALTPIGYFTLPLLAFSTGTFLSGKIKMPKLVATAIAGKMVLGFILGIALCTLLGITGVAKIVVITASCAPVGFNVLAFSSREHLDEELAASMLFVSAAIGLVAVPAIMLLLQ
jgi:hypothetical protein